VANCVTKFIQYYEQVVFSQPQKCSKIAGENQVPKLCRSICITVSKMIYFVLSGTLSLNAAVSQLLTVDEMSSCAYRVAPKNWHNFLHALTLLNINQFFKNSFTIRIRRKFAIMPSVKILPHLKCVGKLRYLVKYN